MILIGLLLVLAFLAGVVGFVVLALMGMHYFTEWFLDWERRHTRHPGLRGKRR